MFFACEFAVHKQMVEARLNRGSPGIADGNLTSVTNPDGTMRRYLYENASLPHAMTGLVDENGERFATWDYDAQGRAVLSQHADGADLTRVSYSEDGSASVTDSLGNMHGYGFTTQYSLTKPIAVTGAPIRTVGGKAFAYDSNGFLASRTDWNGNVTTYAHDTRGLETSRTEAFGTPFARTVTTEWHPGFMEKGPGSIKSFSCPLDLIEPGPFSLAPFPPNF